MCLFFFFFYPTYHLFKQACNIFIVIMMRKEKKKKKAKKVKKNTNERLKLMQKHVALRLLWRMSVDAQKLFLLLGTAAPVTLGGWAGVVLGEGG